MKKALVMITLAVMMTTANGMRGFLYTIDARSWLAEPAATPALRLEPNGHLKIDFVGAVVAARDVGRKRWGSFARYWTVAGGIVQLCPLAVGVKVPVAWVPAGVPWISPAHLFDKASLETIVFEPGSRIARLEKDAFCYSGIKRIFIPSSVAVIGENCFAHCKKLEFVTFELNSGVVRFERYAFWWSGLKQAIIPDSVKVLGAHCFERCADLTTIVFGPDSGLLIIEDRAFTDCAVRRIILPRNIVSIGRGSLAVSDSPGSCELESKSPDFSLWQIGGVEYLLTRVGTELVFGRVVDPIATLALPSYIETMAPGCFLKCRSGSFRFESGSTIRILPEECFMHSELVSIDIPASVERIESQCFSDCSRLHSVTFEGGSKLELIAANAFLDCPLLTSMLVKRGVIFYSCGNYSVHLDPAIPGTDCCTAHIIHR
jgi:hypothetical protein